MPQTYACRKCGRTYSLKAYRQSRFCRDCETFLMVESKVATLVQKKRGLTKKGFRSKHSKLGTFPENYEVREAQAEFIREATKAIGSRKVFLGSAPCGIGKSLASLLSFLPQLKENKLMICFRTRSQLHIYLKELRALPRTPSAISFFNKQDMCPLHLKSRLSYFDFFEECKRLRENCESRIKPQCRFYLKTMRVKKKSEELALDCARRIVAPRETVDLMAEQGFCAYEAMKKVLNRVNVFLGTYHYVFDPQIRRMVMTNFATDLAKTCIIVDEAHNLPAFSRELLSDRLTRRTVERAIKETEIFKHKMLPDVQQCLNLLDEEIFQRAGKKLGKEELKQLNPEEISDLFLGQNTVTGFEAAEILQEYGEYVKEKRLEQGSERVLSSALRVGKFLECFFERDRTECFHMVQRDRQDRVTMEVRSFDGRKITDPVLRQAKGSILMSGFLSPPKVYRDLTLYDQQNVCLKEFDSPFPSENRLILAAEGVSSKFTQRTEKMLEHWRDYIDAVSDENEGNVAVFFTSYVLMHAVLPLVKTNRCKIVEERSTTRLGVIKQLNRSSSNALFGVMGGKFSEGMDYPNNLLTCVVAVGIPYATWSVHQKALINYFERHFPNNGRTYAYLTPAILRLIQACGRVHRSASDKGCIVFLDERVTHPNVKPLLPRYYQEEMKTAETPIDCADQVRSFWEKVRAR